ncbi:hypothetical protein DIPPA_18796 [Diplonema papillatum]|nr:hypothetical protein DIPPA_18796 [Diplonema papillatum]
MTTEEQSTALFTSEQEAELKKRSVELKIGNEKYLRSHPELTDLLNEVLRLTLVDRPDNPVGYVEDIFVNNDLEAMVDDARERKRKMTLTRSSEAGNLTTNTARANPLDRYNLRQGDPVHGNNLRQGDPVHGNNLRQGDPVHGNNLRQGDPVHGNNLRQGDPVHGNNLRQGDPVHGNNLRQGDPVHGNNLRQGDPVHGNSDGPNPLDRYNLRQGDPAWGVRFGNTCQSLRGKRFVHPLL